MNTFFLNVKNIFLLACRFLDLTINMYYSINYLINSQPKSCTHKYIILVVSVGCNSFTLICI